ncbi:MAG: GMC family oxidoreductase [Sandaracinaceae bacterium]|nr:GMC family oxidoreductase [Sandaracinaceae bacterium]
MSGVVEGRHETRPVALEADVVVVGSGAGGMVAATILAEAGLDVLVLEEGGYVPAAVHGKLRQSQSLRHVWREGGMTLALGLGATPGVNVTMGRGVGGSSVVTGGVCLRVPEAILATWSRELGLTALTPEGLDPYYREVEAAVHVEQVPEEMQSRSTRLFGIGAAKLGHPIRPIGRNTKGCHGCGRCNFGCPEQAKMSVDLAYLPRLLAAGGRVWSDCLVERIEHEGGRARGVRGRLLAGPGRRGPRLTVRARVVLVACGGVHSPVLLSASGLAPYGSQVGENMTLHPGFRVFATFDEPVEGWRGALQSAYTDAFERDHVTLMSLFIPGSVIAATMPGAGAALMRRAREVPYVAMFGAMVHDEGPGAVWRHPFGREPVLLYRMSEADRRAMYRGIRLLGETFFAAGARRLYLPVLGLDGPLDADGFRRFELERVPPRRIECSSQHPLGSVQMGTSAATSGVDPDGKLWDTRNVFVCDGSVVPTSLGVNPQLTIMAMATRIAQSLRDRWRSMPLR